MRRWIGTLEWSERCVTLHDAPFRASAYPLLRDIADTIDRVRGGVFIIKFPPQVFKSLFGQLRLARTAAVEPCPSLWYALTGTEAGAFWDTKLSRLLEACQQVQRKRYDDPDARGGRSVFKQPDMTFEMLGADNRNSRNSKSARDIFMDESWQYEPGALREIVKRSDSYETSRRVIIMTTGPSVDDDTDSLWEQSTKSEWRSVCPSCGKAVPCNFGEVEDKGGIRWDSTEATREPGGRWKAVEASATAVWVCPECGGRHKYAPDVQARMSDQKRGAGYVQTNPNPARNVYGWTAEATVFRNWESLVVEWLNACNAKALGSLELVEEFTRKARCRSWDPARMVKINKSIPWGDYLMGDDWPDEGVDASGNPLRFMTVDVQKDHYWAVVRSWSNKAGTFANSRLLYFERLFSPLQIEELRARFKIQPQWVTMDCAWNDQAVYQICHRYGYTAFAAVDVRGNSFLHADGVRRIYDEPRHMDAYAGKLEAGHSFALRIQFSSIAAKFRLEMMRQSRDIAGKPVWTVPKDGPPEYLKQAWGEIMLRKRNPKGGWRTEFKEIGPNHAFDMEAHQCVMASIMGILGSEALVEQEEEDQSTTEP